MGVDEFLNSLGTGGDKDSEKPAWEDLLRPSQVGLILGNVGSGKSGLAYYLLEHLSTKYELLPVVVNLPREKRDLVPENWIIKTLEDIQHTENACVLIDEGTTALPAGSKVEEMVKAFSSLARQRNQIILFIFHSSSDAGSRILRGVHTLMFKEPSQRQIEWGSKDNWIRGLLTEAKEKFRAIAELGGDAREFTFVDCEKPEFRGMVRNPLCTFWTDDLSKAWSGVDTFTGGDKGKQLGFSNPPQPARPAQPMERAERIGWIPLPDGGEQKDESGHYFWVTPEMKARKEKVKTHEFAKSLYYTWMDPVTNMHWIDRVG